MWLKVVFLTLEMKLKFRCIRNSGWKTLILVSFYNKIFLFINVYGFSFEMHFLYYCCAAKSSSKKGHALLKLKQLCSPFFLSNQRVIHLDKLLTIACWRTIFFFRKIITFWSGPKSSWCLERISPRFSIGSLGHLPGVQSETRVQQVSLLMRRDENLPIEASQWRRSWKFRIGIQFGLAQWYFQ